VYRSKSDYGLFLAYALTNPDSAPTAFTVMRDILRNAKKGIKDIDIALFEEFFRAITINAKSICISMCCMVKIFII